MPNAPLCLGATAGARVVLVLVHGRGQSPEEMQAHVLARLDLSQVATVLPRATSGQWYAARAVDPLTDETRAALTTSLAQLGQDIATARADYPGLPLVLAGFSQGACLAIELACTGTTPIAALVAMTGCRVGAAIDNRSTNLAVGLPVYLTGSDADPWIPVSAFAEAALDLCRAGACLRADLFPGRGHEVSQAEIAMLQGILADLALNAAPSMGAAR